MSQDLFNLSSEMILQNIENVDGNNKDCHYIKTKSKTDAECYLNMRKTKSLSLNASKTEYMAVSNNSTSPIL